MRSPMQCNTAKKLTNQLLESEWSWSQYKMFAYFDNSINYMYTDFLECKYNAILPTFKVVSGFESGGGLIAMYSDFHHHLQLGSHD